MAVYCGNQQRSYHGTTVQLVQPNSQLKVSIPPLQDYNPQSSQRSEVTDTYLATGASRDTSTISVTLNTKSTSDLTSVAMVTEDALTSEYVERTHPVAQHPYQLQA